MCGRCRERFIPRGEPVVMIKLAGIKRPRIRCQDCEGPAPPNLPELPPHVTVQPIRKSAVKRMTSTQMVDILAAYRLPHPND